MILPDVEPSTDAAADKGKGTISAATVGEAAASTINHVRPLRVEHLSGYGEARPWALDLKDDLALWREGALGWEEMSTKLLLSGPPGTGKTTFARALCNSTQIPLIVTSVASWLEPGYLGDVLQRMSAVFETAKENAPCIVFIDELDAIGSRGSGRVGDERHEHYWTTVITRVLELLDGSLKNRRGHCGCCHKPARPYRSGIASLRQAGKNMSSSRRLMPKRWRAFSRTIWVPILPPFWLPLQSMP